MSVNKKLIHVLHPGNRGVHWCDIESSRNFVRDDGESTLTFQQYVSKLLDFPLSFFLNKKISLCEKFFVVERNGIQIAIFPNIPGWLAVSNSFENILELMSNGTTFEEINSKFLFAEKQLHCLLVALYIKGGIIVKNKKFSNTIKWSSLYLADELALLELTRNCNLECKHCFNFSGKNLDAELTFDEVCELIDKITNLHSSTTKDKTIALSGGEPFIRKDIFRIIEYINQKGYCAEILTNGTAMPSHFIDRLLKYNIKIRVSLDGCTKETHEKIRGKNTFNKTVRNIKSLLSAGVFTGVTTAITKFNYHELKDIVLFLNHLNINFFKFIIVNQLGRAVDSEVVDYNISRIYEELFFLAQEHQAFYTSMRDSTLANIIACNVAGLFFNRCGVGIQKDYYIQSNGDVFPCRATILPEYKIGNVRTDDISSFDTLPSSVLGNLSQLSVDSLNTDCSECTVRYWCGGDCRGETYQSTGDIYAKAPHCKKLISGIETSLFLCAENPEMYFEKSNAFYNRTNRIDLITQALKEFN